ncbi:MAG: hypothetical protein FWF77_02050 [Defluviitaleaceae bacterium]|nr:hypothetical protein [Defluviitaleaceae bacterium]
MRTKIVIVIALVVLFGGLFVSCGTDEGSQLVGRWNVMWMETSFERMVSREYYEEGEASYEFFSDGNGVMGFGGFQQAFTWSGEDNRLMMTIGGNVILADYIVSRSTLEITYIDYEFEGTHEIVTIFLNRAN